MLPENYYVTCDNDIQQKEVFDWIVQKIGTCGGLSGNGKSKSSNYGIEDGRIRLSLTNYPNNGATTIPYKEWKEQISIKMYTKEDVEKDHLIIYCTTLEEVKAVQQLFSIPDNCILSDLPLYIRGFRVPHIESDKGGCADCFYEGYKIIKFNQLNIPKMDKKIIGYKVPYDMPSIFYKKGDVLNTSDNPNFYSKNRLGKTLPKEIVETWEVVYENTFKEGEVVYIIDGGSGAFGCNNQIGKITNEESTNGFCKEQRSYGIRIANTIWGLPSKGFNIRLLTSEEYDNYNKPLVFNGYSAYIKRLNNRVEFGCQSFTKEELVSILRIMKAPIDAKITIANQELSSEDLGNLITKLN